MNDLRSLWDFDDPLASEARFDELIASTSDPALRAEAITQKARAQGLQRRFEDARLTLTGVAPLLVEGGGRGEAAYWLELGRLENSSGNPDAAKPCFLKALDAAVLAGCEFLAVDAAHMMGIVEKGESSLQWNLRAIEMAEAATEARARNWQGSLLNNTGWTLYGLGRFTEALATFRKALAFREEKGDAGDIRIARYCVAKALRALGQVEESLGLQSELEKEIVLAGSDPGFNWEEIGECLLALGRAEEAALYFAKAFEALSKDAWIVAEEPERLRRLKDLGLDGG